MLRITELLFITLLLASCGPATETAPEPPEGGGTPALPVCGDGLVQGDEACDDGNWDETDACLSTCQTARCGDGVIGREEQCEPETDSDNPHCNADCQLADCGTVFDYQALWVRGFRVCRAEALHDADPDLSEQAVIALEEDLDIIAEALPVVAMNYLKRVTIWLEYEQDFPGGVYHPSPVWLRNNGYPEAWAEGVQLGNAANYMTWVSQQPAIVLHELAHAWHHQYLGYDHEGIQQAFDEAMAAGIYEDVAHVAGGTQRAYATSNRMEYFAELTEAWFWVNDFYPFDRDELKDHDPAGARVIQEAWGLPLP